MDAMTHCSLRLGEVDAMALASRQAGGKDGMNNGESARIRHVAEMTFSFTQAYQTSEALVLTADELRRSDAVALRLSNFPPEAEDSRHPRGTWCASAVPRQYQS